MNIHKPKPNTEEEKKQNKTPDQETAPKEPVLAGMGTVECNCHTLQQVPQLHFPDVCILAHAPTAQRLLHHPAPPARPQVCSWHHTGANAEVFAQPVASVLHRGYSPAGHARVPVPAVITMCPVTSHIYQH